MQDTLITLKFFLRSQRFGLYTALALIANSWICKMWLDSHPKRHVPSIEDYVMLPIITTMVILEIISCAWMLCASAPYLWKLVVDGWKSAQRDRKEWERTHNSDESTLLRGSKH